MCPASGPATGRPRHAVKSALLISVILHGPLVVGSILNRTPARAETPTYDSRVSSFDGRLLLNLEDSVPARKRAGDGGSASQSFNVQVEASAPAPAGTMGEAPHVDLGALVRSLPSQGGARTGTGGGGPASFFRTPIQGNSVVYVIDRSLSMGPSGALAAARTELLASLGALPASAQFQVVFYNSAARPLHIGDSESLLPTDPATLRAAAAIARSTCAEGNTDHVQALRCGLGLRPDILFFVTDADDLSPEQVRVVTAFNHGRTVIHTVCVARRAQGTAALEALARANGGGCLHPLTNQPHP